jgi:DNA-binding beta-propeller fold protein YncE
VKRLALLGAALFAVSAISPLGAQVRQPAPIALLQSIVLPGVDGRMDHMSADVKGRRLFASGLANGTVEVIDLVAGKRVRTITGVREPEGIVYAQDLNLIFVADGEGGAVHAFDGQSYKLLHRITQLPHADNVRYDPGNQRVYVGFGDGADAGIGIINAKEGVLVGTINLEGHPESFQPRGRRMFVNVPTADHIVVLDTGKQSTIEKWTVTAVGGFFPMALDDADQRLFIGSRRPAKLAAFDMRSGQVVASVDGAIDTDDLFYDASRKRVYMSGGDGFVRVFKQRDPDHYELQAQVKTGPGARISLFVPELNRLYVAVPRRGKQDAAVLVFAVR